MNPLDKIHESWKPLVPNLLKAFPELDQLNLMLYGEKYYPNRGDIFNVFQMPLQYIKVVILGQDPYPKEGQARGYAFAVNEDISKPASLRIIEKEVGHELDRTLQNWREQGVFLLNTALTVRAGQVGSHIKYWNNFSKSLIQHISENHYCTWLLLGSKAQSFEPYICKGSPIVKAPHPAAEAYSPGTGFIGSGCFDKINTILESEAKDKINW